MGDHPATSHFARLQCLQKRNQAAFVFRRQTESKRMAWHGPLFDSKPFESSRHVVRPQPCRVKPVFQCSDRAIVFERAAIPDAPKGGHFIVAGAPPRLHGQRRVCPYNRGFDVVDSGVLFRNGKTSGRSELVRCVKGGVWHRPQPARAKTASPCMVSSLTRLGLVEASAQRGTSRGRITVYRSI